jgi:hypothetical protein
MLNFCTLFDSNYSAKGLAMHTSLLRYCNAFHLYIFAFDDIIYDVLSAMNLKYVTVIQLSRFEDERLLQIKKTRTKAEYCWTCTSSTILYCIQQFDLDHCTYVDADLYFFSNPRTLVDEMGAKDVLITSHRYTPEFDTSSVAGKYCVQFMTFKNTENAINILKWWRDACIDWCYARVEDGKFGDQKYLDDWTTRFTGIHELEHLGGGVAPWNMQQYSFVKQGKIIVGTELVSNKRFELVFFHFHAMLAFKKYFFREFYFQAYPLADSTREIVYLPYVAELKRKFHVLNSLDSRIDGIATKTLDMSLWKYTKVIRKRYLNKENKYRYWIDLK